jgi:hypothetical protein
MQAIKQMVKIPKNHKLTIDIPDYIDTNQVGELILILKENKKRIKGLDISQAMNDPLFLADLKKIKEDYKDIDSTGW